LAPVPEPPDSATPQTPSRATRPRRARKFVLPEHHHDEQLDERATEHIEAFLEGPEATPRRRGEDLKRARRPIELDTRPDWMAAVRLEGARHLRYGRPVSVLLIELRQASNGSSTADGIARRLGEVIRAEARETDRAVRTGALTFRVLLPETGGRAARALAERLDRGFRVGADGPSGPAELCVEVATAPRGESLEDAVADAEARLAVKTAR
jgi:GGDEF domain-containing protein